MIVKNNKWRSDEGSIDFIQVVVGLMIISIAAVGTLQGLYYGWQQLDEQMRHRKATSLARSYLEAIQGRVHTDMKEDANNNIFLQGNLARPKTWLLDERDPFTAFDDIYCKVSYGPITKRDFPTTGEGVDQYEIQVHVTWEEPRSIGFGGAFREVAFSGVMVPAGI